MLFARQNPTCTLYHLISKGLSIHLGELRLHIRPFSAPHLIAI